jgi:hypothetical protein
VKIEFNPADQADVTLLHKLLAALLPQPAPIVEVVHTPVAESQTKALAELQAEAQVAGEYAPQPKRRGRPAKQAVAEQPEPPAPAPVEPAPAPVEPAPAPAAATPTQQPTEALEMIYNRDGAAMALACLQRFGVARIRELTPEQVPAFVGYCQGVVAGIENPLEGKA